MFKKLVLWAKKIKLNIGGLFYAVQEPSLSFLRKMPAFLALGYALSPVDLIPDFIPVLGYVDDLILLPLFIYCAIKCIPKTIMMLSLEKAQQSFDKKQHKSYWGAAVIVVLWMGCVYYLLRKIGIG